MLVSPHSTNLSLISSSLFDKSNLNAFTITKHNSRNGVDDDSQDASGSINTRLRLVQSRSPTDIPIPHHSSIRDEPSISLNAGEIYARLLLPQKRGYALWKPKPGNWLPEEYRKEGVRIGDVGIITEFGEFDYFFNACLPADHQLNKDRVPQDFRPFQDVDVADIWSERDAPGSFVSNNDSHFDHRSLSGDPHIPYVLC